MAFYFNENIPENIYYNDNEVLIVKYNDAVVWQKQSPTPPTPSDYAHQYLTFKALSAGTFDYFSDTGATMSYSLNSGSTWSQPSSSITFNVQSGDVVMWCGDNTNGNVGTFMYGTAPFDVEGNAMSLIYGENIDFDNDTEFSGGTSQFNGMFGNKYDGGSQVVHANNLILPSTALTTECYRDMFRDCSGLTTAPSILPATTLANGCYRDMFDGCTSLTTAPELPATTLAASAYTAMFYGCSSLNYIKMLATDISASSCLFNWVQGVANSGTFVKNASMTTLPTGINGIPQGWTVQDYTPPHDYSQDYFTIVAREDGEIQVQPECVNIWHEGEGYEDPETGEWIEGEGYDEYFACPVQYSVNDGVWQTITADTYSPDTFVIEVSTGDEIRFKCNLANEVFQDPYDNTTYHTFDKACSFTSSQGAEFDVQGNIMSLVHGDDFENNTALTYQYTYEVDYGEGPEEVTDTIDTQFSDFFYESWVVDASNLILPSTTLSNSCYYEMFTNCTSLTTAPELPATTLDGYCYLSMFQGCTSLTTAPELPATTLAQGCYRDMFNGCSSLNYIKMLATDISATQCLNNWVYNVANSGTFVKNTSMTSLPTGNSGIPSGWNVQDA